MMNLSAAIFSGIVAIYTYGGIPKGFTILLWCLVGVNLGFFIFNYFSQKLTSTKGKKNYV